MKANKVLLGSFLVASLAACQNEEIMEVGQGSSTLADRPQVELTLSTPAEAVTRMAPDGFSTAYTANDLLGAVLVDGGYNTEKNNVNWTIVNGHVGNNKWFYDTTEKKFKTAGTTAVGAWLFYTKYNEAMTTTRDGVKFHFPQIQEGEVDYSMLSNNNINFFISPILAVDGYEGQKVDLTVKYASVYNQLRMAFDLKAVGATKVQKVIVRHWNSTDPETREIIPFATDYKVVNTTLPIAKLSLKNNADAVKCPNHVAPTTTGVNLADQNQEILIKLAAMCGSGIDWTSGSFTNIIADANEETNVDYLVVDFDKNHSNSASTDGGLAITDGKFSAMMLIPSGTYENLEFEIYTDKGVFAKTISDRNAYRENITADAPAQKGAENIILRPNFLTLLSDIENVYEVDDEVTDNAGELEAEEYIKIATTDKTKNEGVITKTADLINLINGIQAKGDHIVNVIKQDQVGKNNGVDDEAIPAHAVVVNKAVMDALIAKEKALKDDIQLIFKGAEVLVYGESADAPLEIRDMTFNNGCSVENGYINVTSDLVIPAEQKMTIKATSNVELSLNNLKTANPVVYHDFAQVVNNGTVKVSSANLKIADFDNNGKVTVNTTVENATAQLVSDDFQNLVNNTKLTIGTQGKAHLALFKNVATTAEVTNNGDLTLTAGENNGLITNLKDITVLGEFTNNKTITNGSTESGLALILAKGDNGTLNNAKGADITNYGSMYCYQGENTINNLGTIYAKEKSTTYITTNSKLNETETATNADGTQVMGVIVLDRRNEDISVTTANRQGYIQYTIPASDIVSGKFDVKSGDKYNKVIVNNSVEFTANAANRINFIVTKGEGAELTLPKNSQFQEVEFHANTNIYSDEFEPATIAHITVKGESTQVKVPTENTLFVYNVDATTSTTTAEIDNEGRIIVGGDLYTLLSQPSKGIFASGHGMATAFHWGETEKPSLLQ